MVGELGGAEVRRYWRQEGCREEWVFELSRMLWVGSVKEGLGGQDWDKKGTEEGKPSEVVEVVAGAVRRVAGGRIGS